MLDTKTSSYDFQILEFDLGDSSFKDTSQEPGTVSWL